MKTGADLMFLSLPSICMQMLEDGKKFCLLSLVNSWLKCLIIYGERHLTNRLLDSAIQYGVDDRPRFQQFELFYFYYSKEKP